MRHLPNSLICIWNEMNWAKVKNKEWNENQTCWLWIPESKFIIIKRREWERVREREESFVLLLNLFTFDLSEIVNNFRKKAGHVNRIDCINAKLHLDADK